MHTILSCVKNFIIYRIDYLAFTTDHSNIYICFWTRRFFKIIIVHFCHTYNIASVPVEIVTE